MNVKDLEEQLSFWKKSYQEEVSARLKTEEQLAEARERIKVLDKGLNAVCLLIDESYGVCGLHLNMDVAPWAELRTGGIFEHWLIDFDESNK